jgi:aldose 1-epimerase
LGFDDAAGYVTERGYLGATVGRFANRIRDARFQLDGATYTLAANQAPNHLHGGSVGFDQRVWDVGMAADGYGVTFSLVSPDGDEGYPGRLAVTVEYRLEADHTVRLTMAATTDAPTVVNLTNHAYYNLGGHASGTVLDHLVEVAADHHTPVDAAIVPTGQITPVAGTPADLRAPTGLGERFTSAGLDAGYDGNWVLRGERGVLRRAAVLTHPGSGRRLSLATTEAGIQLYTAAHLDGSVAGKGGVRYPRFAGIALETQTFPDAPNQPAFPSARLEPSDRYEHVTTLRFDTV